MGSVKVTFSLDPETVATLNRTAERLDRPKSQVVREAIAEYAERVSRPGEGERRRRLCRFDELVPRIPVRPEAEVDRELAEIRRSRTLRDPVRDAHGMLSRKRSLTQALLEERRLERLREDG